MDISARRQRILEQIQQVDDEALLSKVESLLFAPVPPAAGPRVPHSLEEAVLMGMDDVRHNRLFAHLSLKTAWL